MKDDDTNKEPAIIGFMTKLRDHGDRGTMALLRGALTGSKDRQMRALRVLAPYGGLSDGEANSEYRAEVVRTIAGLMSLPRLKDCDTRSGRNFGHACRQLLSDEERKDLHKPEKVGPISRRMQHLLAATRTEVCDRVCSLARRLDASDQGFIDFARLYQDLRYWGDKTCGAWAGSFWGAALEAEAQETISKSKEVTE